MFLGSVLQVLYVRLSVIPILNTPDGAHWICHHVWTSASCTNGSCRGAAGRGADGWKNNQDWRQVLRLSHRGGADPQVSIVSVTPERGTRFFHEPSVHLHVSRTSTGLASNPRVGSFCCQRAWSTYERAHVASLPFLTFLQRLHGG